MKKSSNFVTAETWEPWEENEQLYHVSDVALQKASDLGFSCVNP